MNNEMNREKWSRIAENEKWFSWYEIQVSQAQRAQRTGTEWHTSDGTKTYYSLSELDIEANNRQNEIRSLKAQMQIGRY